MNRSGSIAVLALVVAGSSASAQTRVEWDFQETTFVEVFHLAKQEISVAANARISETKVRFLFKVRPIKVGRTTTTFEATIVDCDDSTTTKGGKPETGTFKGFKDLTFRVTAGTDNQTLELAVPKEKAEGAFGEAEAATDVEKEFARDMVDAILRVHLLDAFVPLPGKAVAVGDKWRNTAELKIQSLAQMSAARDYVLGGRQIHDGRRVDAIGWTSQVEIKPLNDERGLFPFKVKEIKLVGKPTNEGTVLWDTAANRPVRVDSLQSWELDMAMEIDGKTVKGKGKGSDAFVVRFFAKNPDEK